MRSKSFSVRPIASFLRRRYYGYGYVSNCIILDTHGNVSYWYLADWEAHNFRVGPAGCSGFTDGCSEPLSYRGSASEPGAHFAIYFTPCLKEDAHDYGGALACVAGTEKLISRRN